MHPTLGVAYLEGQGSKIGGLNIDHQMGRNCFIRSTSAPLEVPLVHSILLLARRGLEPSRLFAGLRKGSIPDSTSLVNRGRRSRQASRDLTAGVLTVAKFLK